MTLPTGPLSAESQNSQAETKKSTETTSDKRFKFSPSEGILLATASASAYLWTFQYERGFASHFGVPGQFINVSLTNVLFVAALVAGVILFAIPVANALVMILLPRVNSHPLLLHHATTIFIILPVALLPAYVYGTLRTWMAGLGMVAFLVSYIFMLPLLNRQEVGYLKKLEAQAKRDQIIGATTVFGLASHRLGPNLAGALFLFIYSFYFALVAGDAAAATQKDFLVTTFPSSSSEMVLLRVYGDDLIFASFNRNTKEVEKSFTILRVSDFKTSLTLEVVGPLKPVPPAKPQPPQPSPVPSPQQEQSVPSNAEPTGTSSPKN